MEARVGSEEEICGKYDQKFGLVQLYLAFLWSYARCINSNLPAVGSLKLERCTRFITFGR